MSGKHLIGGLTAASFLAMASASSITAQGARHDNHPVIKKPLR